LLPLPTAGADKNETSRQKKDSKTVKDGSKLITRASKIEACGFLGAILAPRQLLTAKKQFWGFPRPSQKGLFWTPFRFMLPSRGALRLKIKALGGSGCVAEFFFKRFSVISGGVLGSKTSISRWMG